MSDVDLIPKERDIDSDEVTIIIDEEINEEGKNCFSFTRHQGRVSWWHMGQYPTPEEAREAANSIHR